MGLYNDKHRLGICFGHILDDLIDNQSNLIAQNLCSGYSTYLNSNNDSQKKSLLLHNSDNDTLKLLKGKMKSIFKDGGETIPISFSLENVSTKLNISKLESNFYLIDIGYFLKNPPKH